MGQILKEDLKNRIIEAAKNEFLSHGFANASMRSIASSCSMTVGNLYRYFKNKDELHRFIVFKPLQEIETLVSQLTNQQLSLKENARSASFNTSELLDMLKRLSDSLVEIFSSHSIEFKILIMQTQLRNQLIDWFKNVISLLISNAYPEVISTSQIELLSLSYANSIFHGVATMFLQSRVSKQQLKETLNIYFNSFALMLNSKQNPFKEE